MLQPNLYGMATLDDSVIPMSQLQYNNQRALSYEV